MALERPNLRFESQLKYDIGKIIPWVVPANQFDILSSGYCAMIKQLPVSGTYKIVKEIFRPDLLSYAIYYDVKYKIPLMLYNDMFTLSDCYQGRLVSYPSLFDLDELLFSLAISNNLS